LFIVNLYHIGNIDNFDGIKIYVNGREHLPPHFHCYYAEYHILIDIKTLEIVAGNMPKSQLKKIKKWASGKENELLIIFKMLNPQLKF